MRELTGDILRILLLLLQLGFVALLYLVLIRFAGLAAARPAQRRAGADRLALGDRRASRCSSRRRTSHRSARRIALGPINSIGRNVNNTIYVEDDFVSSNHAMLTFRGRAWFVEDQGSTNGTYVNGHRIDRPVALSFGDELTIGRVRMRLDR